MILKLLILSILTIPIYALDLELITEKVKKPIHLCSPLDNSNTLYVIEQGGKIIKIDSNKKTSVFLDLQKKVKKPTFPGDERGLLGMAFHPNYINNGYFFINYINNDGDTIISRIQYKNDTNSFNEKILIKLEQPYANHNGGHLEFGDDGYLYIAVGDGGSAGDPGNNAQNLSNFLGKILRIDVDAEKYNIPINNPFINSNGAKSEIWAYGLRNPWKFSFDSMTKSIFIADVGQNSWEEINIQNMQKGGLNYGWRIKEGSHIYSEKQWAQSSNKKDLIDPFFEYPSDANYGKTLTGFKQSSKVSGCSITGGYVYRGNNLEDIIGHYFFADYCTGKIWSIKNFNTDNFKLIDWTDDLLDNVKGQLYISSFGKDQNNNLYILDHNGAIYKIIEEI